MIRRPPRSTLFPTRRSSDLPAMGDYLDMVHNDKPNPQKNTEPNENYAREIMQLFTIGLYKRSEEHTSELQSHVNLVCRLLLEKKKKKKTTQKKTKQTNTK